MLVLFSYTECDKLAKNRVKQQYNRFQLAIITGISIMLIGVLFAYFQLSSFGANNAGRNNNVALNVSNNVALTGGGTGVVVEITSDDFVATTGSGVLNIAELVIEFDNTILRLDDMQANSSLLALNENINNSNGSATIDLAQPVTEFPAGTTLVTLTFAALEQTDTVVSLDHSTTWGYPNRMNFAASNTDFDVDFPEPSSSATTSSSTASGCANTAVGNGRSHQICANYFILQAEDFNNGGNGVGYNDLDAMATDSEYDPNYRSGETVDVKAPVNGVRAVGYNRAGEWLNFTVNVPQAGAYRVTARVAMDSSSGQLGVAVNGGSNVATGTVPNTGNYNTFADLVLNNNVTLAAGSQTIRFNVIQQYFDIDYLRFDLVAASSSSTSTSTSTATTSSATTTTTSSVSTTTTTTTTTSVSTTTSSATTSSVSTTTSSSSSSAGSDISRLYRFYNTATGAHFFTPDEGQALRVCERFVPPFQNESIGFYVYGNPGAGRIPVYRFYNPSKGTHLYMSGDEGKRAITEDPRFNTVYQIEPITGEPAFYVNAEAAGTPVYRFYNAKTGAHFYTASITQRNTLLTNPLFSAFQYEGVKYYVPAGPNGSEGYTCPQAAQ